MKSALGVEWTSFMHADWPAIQGIGKAKNCTQADTDTRQVRPPREHAGPWPARAGLTRPNSPGSRDPTPTGSHLGNHARTPGETHLLSCAAAHDQHDGEAELKRILRDLGPHRGEALRDRARLPNRHFVRGSSQTPVASEWEGLVDCFFTVYLTAPNPICHSDSGKRPGFLTKPYKR